MTMNITMTTRLVVALLGSLLLAPTLLEAWVLPPTTARSHLIGHQPYQATIAAITRSQSFLSASLYNNATEAATAEQSNDKKKSGYVRAEEWDAQRKTSLQWEEKVKFDGHVNGNRWQQHEILRQNLHR